MARTGGKHFSRSVLIGGLLVGITCSIALGEGLARLLMTQPGLVKFGPLSLPGLWNAHPSRDYTLAPAHSGTLKTGSFDMTMRTNRHG